MLSLTCPCQVPHIDTESVCVYIYIYIHMCVCVCVWVREALNHDTVSRSSLLRVYPSVDSGALITHASIKASERDLAESAHKESMRCRKAKKRRCTKERTFFRGPRRARTSTLVDGRLADVLGFSHEAGEELAETEGLGGAGRGVGGRSRWQMGG